MRDENVLPRVAAVPAEPFPRPPARTPRSDEDESDEQPGCGSRRSGAGGERRPRRRGRRGGRRRRGGPEDGLAGSIVDELGPTSAPEASKRGGRFRRLPPRCHRSGDQPEASAPPPEPPHAEPAQPEPACVPRPRRDRPGGRTRRAAAVDRAREGQFPGRRHSPRRRRPSSSASPNRAPSPVPTRRFRGPRRHPASPRGMVVAALR